MDLRKISQYRTSKRRYIHCADDADDADDAEDKMWNSKVAATWIEVRSMRGTYYGYAVGSMGVVFDAKEREEVRLFSNWMHPKYNEYNPLIIST